MRSDIVDVMSDIVDLISKIKCCDVIKGGCDVICSSYDVTHIVGLMSYKSGCDIRREVVMTKIEWV